MIGNVIQVIQSIMKSKRDGDNFFLMQHMYEKNVLNDYNVTTIFFVTNGAHLTIQDPVVVGELYTSKNKYFDKHPLTKEISRCLTGESILFAETTKDWKDTRKAISPAFY